MNIRVNQLNMTCPPGDHSVDTRGFAKRDYAVIFGNR